MDKRRRSKRYNNLTEAFWAKVSKTETCWLWTGRTIAADYGLFDVKGRVTYAHRHSWEIHQGAIPHGVFVCHECDTPRCVNPDHLFLGFQKENIDDMHRKKRGAVGETHGNHKLTLSEVEEILAVYAQGGVSQYALADRYGVTRSCIGLVVQGRRWTRAIKQQSE